VKFLCLVLQSPRHRARRIQLSHMRHWLKTNNPSLSYSVSTPQTIECQSFKLLFFFAHTINYSCNSLHIGLNSRLSWSTRYMTTCAHQTMMMWHCVFTWHQLALWTFGKFEIFINVWLNLIQKNLAKSHKTWQNFQTDSPNYFKLSQLVSSYCFRLLLFSKFPNFHQNLHNLTKYNQLIQIV
jgi:hypothetical protein